MTCPHPPKKYRADGAGEVVERSNLVKNRRVSLVAGKDRVLAAVFCLAVAVIAWGVFVRSSSAISPREDSSCKTSVVIAGGGSQAPIFSREQVVRTSPDPVPDVDGINRLLQERSLCFQKAGALMSGDWTAKIDASVGKGDAAKAKEVIEICSRLIGKLNIAGDIKQLAFFLPQTTQSEHIALLDLIAKTHAGELRKAISVAGSSDFKFEMPELGSVTSQKEFLATISKISNSTNDILDFYVQHFALQAELNDTYYEGATWLALAGCVETKIKLDYKIDLTPSVSVKGEWETPRHH